MKIKLSELYSEFKNKNIVSEMIGGDADIESVKSVGNFDSRSLVFIENEKFLSMLGDQKPAAAVISPPLKDLFSGKPEFPLLVSENVSLASALIRQKLEDDIRGTEWGEVHASAVVHDTAVIGRGTVIGPNAVIGAGVKIGERCAVMANTVIEKNCSVGDETIIFSGCVIGYDTEIGSRVMIQSGTVIGSEGFGYAQDKDRRSYRVPQIGKVVLEDDVSLGANNCIDRATFEETRIRRGTKTDNLCHIAHNVEIGEDCLLTAGFIVAGSTKIGNRMIASGQTGILDHLKICDDVILVHRAGVTENIDKPGVYAGLPVQPLRTYMKNLAIVRKIDELRKTVLRLDKK